MRPPSNEGLESTEALSTDLCLEVESKLRRVAPWRYVVRPTEGRQKVIEGNLIAQIDGGQCSKEPNFHRTELPEPAHTKRAAPYWCV